MGKPKQPEKITAGALRKMLWSEIYAIRKDRELAPSGRTVARLAAQVLDSVRVEMALCQMVGVPPRNDFVIE